MKVAAKDLRVGDRRDRWEVTSDPIPSACGPGFVSFSMETHEGGWAGGIRKEPGEDIWEVERETPSV